MALVLLETFDKRDRIERPSHLIAIVLSGGAKLFRAGVEGLLRDTELPQ